MSDDEGDHSHYNNGNRAFLQAVMARGTITMKEGQLLLAEIFSIQEGAFSPPPILSLSINTPQAAA
jgi:hypothetical protein